MDYDTLLDNAFENMPESAKHRDRFVIPKVSGHVEGSKTVIKNISEIAKKLERDEQHLMKFLLRELATPGTFQGSRFVFGSKLSPVLINEKVQKYADNFVFCPACGKPDTYLVKEKEGSFMICKACGAKSSVRDF
ncbi:MAG: translation initiation factor IF-2 subunit beta [Candidatus Woesearchaeota archaeon]